MKRCPQCDLAYVDETLNFCLEDGTPLTYAGSDDAVATRILSGSDQRESPTVVLRDSQNAVLRSIAVLPFSNISADPANESLRGRH